MDGNEDSYVYVPLTDTVNASCWCVDASLMLITNVTEESAGSLAESYPGHIYFFAELVPPEESHFDSVIHRDASTGKFVSEEYTQEHPETTVTESKED